MKFRCAAGDDRKTGDTDRASEIPDGKHLAIASYVRIPPDRDDSFSVVWAVIAPDEEYHLAGFWDSFAVTARAKDRLAALVAAVTDIDPYAKDYELDPEVDILGGVAIIDVKTDEKNRKVTTFAGFAKPTADAVGDKKLVEGLRQQVTAKRRKSDEGVDDGEAGEAGEAEAVDDIVLPPF